MREKFLAQRLLWEQLRSLTINGLHSAGLTVRFQGHCVTPNTRALPCVEDSGPSLLTAVCVWSDGQWRVRGLALHVLSMDPHRSLSSASVEPQA